MGLNRSVKFNWRKTMQVENKSVQLIKITGAKNLDLINVVLDDHEQGKGTIIIECYGESWGTYWGAMSGKTLTEFFCGCDEHYIAKNLATIESSLTDYEAIPSEYINDESDMKANTGIMQGLYGDEWWHDLPQKPNPDYQYLCRIIKAVQEALKDYKK